MLALAACGKERDPRDVAAEACKARYDNIQRWITGRGRAPGTPEELVSAAKRTEKDPWGNPYEIEFERGKYIVWSRGPDGVERTADDIIYPDEED